MMTTKKLLIILIVSVITTLVAGVTIFFVVNANKTVYATSLTASTDEITLKVNEECYIYDKINFTIEPSNCTQSIQFAVDNIAVCNLQTGTRKLKARAVGECMLRASVKKSANEYIRKYIAIRVFDDENPLEIYATSISPTKDNIMLKVGESIKIDEIFTVLPQNCNQNIQISVSNNQICSYDQTTGYLTATTAENCKLIAKIKSGESTELSTQIDIIIKENQTSQSISKEIIFDEQNQNNNVFVIDIVQDNPEFENLGKIYLNAIYDENTIQLLEVDLNTYKVSCQCIGEFVFVLQNSLYNITYNLIAKQNSSLSIASNITNINIKVGEEFDLSQMAFENLPDEYQIEYSVTNTNAQIVENKLYGTAVGVNQLIATINHAGETDVVSFDICITKNTITYYLEFALTNEYASINIYQNEIALKIKPNYDLVNVSVQNPNILSVEAIDGGTLIIGLINAGSTTISLTNVNMDIIINITITQ